MSRCSINQWEKAKLLTEKWVKGLDQELPRGRSARGFCGWEGAQVQRQSGKCSLILPWGALPEPLGRQKSVQPLWKRVLTYLLKLKKCKPRDPAIPLWAKCSRQRKSAGTCSGQLFWQLPGSRDKPGGHHPLPAWAGAVSSCAGMFHNQEKAATSCWEYGWVSPTRPWWRGKRRRNPHSTRLREGPTKSYC